MGFEERGKALEEAFFAKKNKELLAQVKQDLDSASQREALKQATGIQDDSMLNALVNAGITSESLTAMTIAPLVLVAWADGTIDEKEREAVMSAAEQSGIKGDSTAGKLLKGWLDEQPDDGLADAWKDYIQVVREALQAGEQVNLKQQVLGRSKSVAEAAGGFLGLGSISPSEQRMLEFLTAAFD